MVWLCFNKTFFSETVVGQIWLTGHSFLTLEYSNSQWTNYNYHNNVYEYHKYNGEQKKADAGEYTLYDCSYLNFNARQNHKSIVLEVRRVDIVEGGR